MPGCSRIFCFSFNSQAKKKTSNRADPKTAGCFTLKPGGAFAVKTVDPLFAGQVSLEFWVKTSSGVPDININIAGPKVGQNKVLLRILPFFFFSSSVNNLANWCCSGQLI